MLTVSVRSSRIRIDMECLKLCVAFGLASVACGSAASGPLSYLLQYKRSVLTNPTGLAAFNGFGGDPFGFAAYSQPGLAAYSQPGFAAYGQPAGLSAYGQPGFGAYGLGGDLRPHQARAFAPTAGFQYGYGLDAAPGSGHPYAVHYKLSPAVAAPQLVYAPAAAQQSNAAPNPAPRQPAQDNARQVRVMSPTVAAEPTRLQIPSSYRPAPSTDAAAAPSSATAAVPDLFLELRPPHHSEPSIDYSRQPSSEPYPAPVPFPDGVQAAYLMPSITYGLPTNTYSHTEPNAVHGKTAPGAPPNDFASNALYGEPEPGGAAGYYDAPTAAPPGGSDPTSANAYGDPNPIQSGAAPAHRPDDKPIAGGVRGGRPTSSDTKRDTSYTYYGGDYKNVQRDTY